MKRTAMKWMMGAGVCLSLTGICHADPTFGDVMRAAGTYVSPIINPGFVFTPAHAMAAGLPCADRSHRSALQAQRESVAPSIQPGDAFSEITGLLETLAASCAA